MKTIRFLFSLYLLIIDEGVSCTDDTPSLAIKIV